MPEGQGFPALCKFYHWRQWDIYLKSKIFPIDSMITDNGQKLAMMLEI